MPPIQWVRLRQNRTPCGSPSISVRIDAPVVVSPETVSKNAFVNDGIAPERRKVPFGPGDAMEEKPDERRDDRGHEKRGPVVVPVVEGERNGKEHGRRQDHQEDPDDVQYGGNPHGALLE